MSDTPPPPADRTSATSDSPDDVEEVPCVWFFLPLPHPLPLPDKWQLRRSADPRAVIAVGAPLVKSSLVIHQLTPGVDPFLAAMSDLWRFASATVVGERVEPLPAPLAEMLAADGVDTSAIAGVRTIAEVAVAGVDASDHSNVIAALDVALEHVRFVHRSVSHVTQGPVRLIARETLPIFVPTFSGVVFSVPADSDTDTIRKFKPRIDTAIELEVPDCAPPAALGLAPEALTGEKLRRVYDAAEYVGRSAGFQTYADMRREAMVQRDFDGNARMAVVALATAGEVFLDTMLLHLLWEERTEPADAAAYFDRSEGHVSRIRKHFPPRLGGSWDPESTVAPGRYQRDLVRLRHRVVHAGHEPTADELKAAWAALFDLEKYVSDRLVAGPRLKKYTRTAMAWMAQDGLKRRGRWTKFVQTLTSDPREPNWKDTFIRWRHHVERDLDPSPPKPGADVTELLLYADKLPDGSINWILHDNATAYAAAVDPHSVCSTQVVEEITAWLTATNSADIADNRASAAVDRVPRGLTWRRDDLVFPELTIFPGPIAER